MKEPLTSYEEILRAFSVLGKGAHVGLHSITCTPEELERAYLGAKWYLLYNPPFGNVLQVVHDLGEQGLLWESFANVDGDERHWVHYDYERWESPRLWSQMVPSPDKPDEVIGKQWYAYRVPDLNPYLVQKQNREEN